MLEKPALPDEKILACLQEQYGLPAERAVFLPLGADVNAAVYRVTADGKPYFVKLRAGEFSEISVRLPRYLHDQGIQPVIPPLATQSGGLWARLGDFWVVVYPFVEGRSGFEVVLSPGQWADLGRALKRLHTLSLPAGLAGCIAQESYSPAWRESTRAFVERAQVEVFPDRMAEKTAALLRARRGEILDLVGRAEGLAGILAARPAEHVLCHADIHAGNLLVDGEGALYIVDWDNPIRAPKERDLMYFGGAQGFCGYTAQEEQRLFYQGYGPTPVDAVALAYYRYERIVQDIAEFCKQLLLTSQGGDDREQSYGYLASNFLPGNTIEIAYQADTTGLG